MLVFFCWWWVGTPGGGECVVDALEKWEHRASQRRGLVGCLRGKLEEEEEGGREETFFPKKMMLSARG